MAIPEKTNEMTAIPELVSMIETEGSLITVDAIGATERIMNAIHNNGADFLLQVKGNSPELFGEIKSLFGGLSDDRENDAVKFEKEYGEKYSEAKTWEKNRERYENRHYQAFNDPDGLGDITEIRPYIRSIGLSEQIRILKVKDKDGNDITPNVADFLKNGSRKQPNSLHYVLDEVFGEDKSPIRKGKNAASALRKMAYNIIRLMQFLNPERSPYVPDIIDDIIDDFNMGAKMVFEPIPSQY